MVFWILVIAFVITIAWLGFEFAPDFGVIGGFLFWVVSSAFAAFCYFLVLGAVMWMSPVEWKSPTYERVALRALDTGSSIQGRSYFLGGGYIDGKRVLNYIVKHEDGSNEVLDIEAEGVKIWEDTPEKPYLEIETKEGGNPWIAPGDYREEKTRSFHIPNGSIIDSTKITNK